MMGIKRGWFGESHRHYLAAKGVKTNPPGQARSYLASITGRAFELSDMARRRQSTSGDPVAARRIAVESEMSRLRSEVSQEEIDRQKKDIKTELGGPGVVKLRQGLAAQQREEVASLLGVAPDQISNAVSTKRVASFLADIDPPGSEAKRNEVGEKLFEQWQAAEEGVAKGYITPTQRAFIRQSIERVSPELYRERFRIEPRTIQQAVRSESKENRPPPLPEKVARPRFKSDAQRKKEERQSREADRLAMEVERKAKEQVRRLVREGTYSDAERKLLDKLTRKGISVEKYFNASPAQQKRMLGEGDKK